MWLLLLMPPQLIGPFIFRDLGYLYQLVVPDQVPCVGLILPCRSFRLLPSCYTGWPSTSLVRWLPCIWITALLKLTCVIKVVQCLLFFPGWSAGYQVWLTSMVLLLFQHTVLPTSMLRQIICPGMSCFWSGIFSSGGSGSFLLLGPSRGVPTCIFSFYSMPALFHLGNSTTSGGLGVECLQPSLEFQVGYVCPPLALVPLVLSKFLAEHVDGQLRHLILVAPCLMKAPWLPTVLNMLVDVPWWCPIIKDLIIDVLVGQVLKGLQYLHLTLWQLSNVCYADRGSLPQSVRWWWGQLECLHQRSTSSAGKNGPDGVLDQVYQTMPSLPLNYQIFCYILFRLTWHGVPLVYIILLFLLFWSLIRFTRLLIILSSQN